ncbi:hypothetical protein GCM10011611_34160 [Aliidongia dinghuensis]|uniref:DUF1203 domain-containing protein n=1 Tax=Aliidongia dinghuensis TaxID=1867774 RepID=A0A8J3E495_9PROT|nr:DUF1203 domain-containing protein [Aliidongia dinghuensis]GGF25296.1 hypothetical protein GCM10011611_34160 [Aliidongia dinghuensis]
MNFRITGLSPEPFRALFGLSDEELACRGAQRVIADAKPGYPDRIEVRDAEVGEPLLLVNYTHQPADTPYRASHAVFVREGAETTYDQVNEVPDAMRSRWLSVRAFDAGHLMIDADLVEGSALESLIERFLANPDVAYLQAHYAKRGCYAARIERA